MAEQQWTALLSDIQNADLSNNARIKQLNEQLLRQAEWLQAQARNFYLTNNNNDREAAAGGAVSPLLTIGAVLNPQENSLGLTHLLAAQADVQRALDRMQFIELGCRLLQCCDPQQVQIVPRQFYAVCQRVAEECARARCPAAAIMPLHHAGCVVVTSETCLSPIHAEMLYCCLLAKRYDFAVRFLDGRPVLEVDPKRTALTPPNLLRYLYLAGVAYVGLKRWRAAMDYFRSCLSMPATAPSAVAVEAYKKLVMVSLIADGAAPSLPKHTPNVVSRQLRSNAVPYSTLADRFKDGNTAKLAGVLRDYGDVISRDGNLGLVKQVVAALTRWKVRRLTSTYISLSLQDIATQAGLSGGPAEAEKLLLAMVEKGDISAHIEHPSGTVTFTEDDTLGESVYTHAMLSRMEKELQETLQLAERVTKIDADLATTYRYISRTTDRGGGATGGGGSSAALASMMAMQMGGDAAALDIDMDEEMALSMMSEENGAFEMQHR